MRRQARSALDRGADLVELRLDYLHQPTAESIRTLAAEFHNRCVCTLRPADQGGRYVGPETERINLLHAAAAGNPRFIDFEYARIAENAAHPDEIPRGTDGLIVSHHDFIGPPSDPTRLANDIAAIPHCAITKLAWAAQDVAENFRALDLLRTTSTPTIALCMGRAGLLSRVLGRKFGAAATYCSVDVGSESAPGQPTLDDMRECFRWHHIDSDTDLFGLIGWPVAHSLSPDIFNAAFQHHNINAVYLPLPVRPGPEAFTQFLNAVLERPWLGLQGLSVTLPHKQNAFRNCSPPTDPSARRSEAVNTLKFDGPQTEGTNTDAPAAIASIAHTMQCTIEELSGIDVDLLGAGGVARSIAAALAHAGCNVTIYNRTPQRADQLARFCRARSAPWQSRTDRRGRILINCTSVGMWPDVNESPIPADALDPELTVFDTVYNPPQTRLLTDAAARGCRTLPGMDMFIRQAALQFEAWTARPAPTEIMKRAAQAALARFAEKS